MDICCYISPHWLLCCGLSLKDAVGNTFSSHTWSWMASSGLQNDRFSSQTHLLFYSDLLTDLFSCYCLVSPWYKLTFFFLDWRRGFLPNINNLMKWVSSIPLHACVQPSDWGQPSQATLILPELCIMVVSTEASWKQTLFLNYAVS